MARLDSRLRNTPIFCARDPSTRLPVSRDTSDTQGRASARRSAHLRAGRRRSRRDLLQHRQECPDVAGDQMKAAICVVGGVNGDRTEHQTVLVVGRQGSLSGRSRLRETREDGEAGSPLHTAPSWRIQTSLNSPSTASSSVEPSAAAPVGSPSGVPPVDPLPSPPVGEAAW